MIDGTRSADVDPMNGAMEHGIPPQVIEAFQAVAAAQRGRPEELMEQAQLYAPGLYTYLLEHVGDLSHRLFEWWPTRVFGVKKIDKALRRLDPPADMMRFEAEVAQQLRGNAARRGLSLDDYLAGVAARGAAYAQAHAQLPAYNRVGYLAREAAVALGRQQFDRARAALRDLQSLARGGQWEAAVREFRLDAAGQLVPYLPGGTTASRRPSAALEIEPLRLALAQAADRVLQDVACYRAQTLREEWEHEGGYCDEIAEALADVLDAAGIAAVVQSSAHGSQHTFVVSRGLGGEAVVVDVPFPVYEIERGAYVFDLVPGARITAADVVIAPLGQPFDDGELESDEGWIV